MNNVCGTVIEGIEKKIKECPKCGGTNTFKTRMKGILFFEDKEGNVLDPDDYDLVVIDECHRIKESTTAWTKIIRKAFRDSIDKKILISGTAIKSRPMEFFTILNFLHPDIWNSMHHFGVKYGAGFQSKFGWKYDGASNLDNLFERISPYFLRRLKREVLQDLPPKTYTNIPIELTTKEMSEYKKIEKESADNEEGFLEKIHKLKACTGRAKVKRAIEMAEDIIAGGEKVVIMSDYQELAESLKEHFGDSAVIHTGMMDDVDKQESVDRFQEDKKVKVFCGMIDASGVGITLTEASKLIFVGFAWTPADMEQAEDRIHRATTTHDNIEIIKLICEDTIDVDIDELLTEKSKVVSKVLDNKEFKKDINISSESIYSALASRMK
jgi:SWI/SNF-related matrix-associated actin-dependent regulator 1 of chromatin subfamily A